MRDYGKVYSTFWSSEDMRALSEDGRMLALYLMSCPHGNMLGCFRLPDGYVVEDMQWESGRVSKGFGELFEKGFSYRCERTFWVFIRKHLEWNLVENPNVGIAAGKLFDSLSAPGHVKSLLVNALREHSPHFPVAKLNDFETSSEPYANPFDTLSKPVTVTVAVTVTKQEQEQESPQSADAPTSAERDSPPERREKRRGTAADEKCARWLYGVILDNNPEAKAPNIPAWANEIRLMRERDNRTLEAICELFQWAQLDKFWCANVLSPASLRDKWDQLTMQRKRKDGAAQASAPTDLAAAQRAANEEAKRRLGIGQPEVINAN